MTPRRLTTLAGALLLIGSLALPTTASAAPPMAQSSMAAANRAPARSAAVAPQQRASFRQRLVNGLRNVRQLFKRRPAVRTTEWTAKGTHFRQVTYLDRNGKSVGYERTITGKNGRQTVITKDAEGRSVQKRWNGKNGTLFTATKRVSPDGVTSSERAAYGSRGGMSSRYQDSAGAKGRTKAWRAKNTIFVDTAATAADGTKSHSRQGFPVPRIGE